MTLATEYVVIFDTVTGNWLVKQAGSAHIADLAVVSGKLGVGSVISGAIASGQIAGAHIAAQGILSANIGTNILATAHIANQGILSASVGANILATPHFAAQGILSASYAGGSVANAHIANQGILSSAIGTNILATPHFAAQGILSASYAGGSVANAHIANQGLLSSAIGTKILATPHFLDQGILSASIGAGAIGHSLVADRGIISGKVDSGAITEAGLASGISIDISETSQEPTFRAALSGILAMEAVVFTASGYFNWARAAQSGQYPAVGLMAAAPNSGALGTILTVGRVANTGWNFSGYIGQPLYLSTSSQVATTPPSASGNVVQRVGQGISQVSMFLMPNPLTFQIGQ